MLVTTIRFCETYIDILYIETAANNFNKFQRSTKLNVFGLVFFCANAGLALTDELKDVKAKVSMVYQRNDHITAHELFRETKVCVAHSNA